MNMIHSDAHPVWVLIFDSEPTDCEFDRLDLESTCFEQFLLQDVRNSISPDEVFGGESALSRLSDSMRSRGQTTSLVTFTNGNTSIAEYPKRKDMESSMLHCHMPLIAVTKLSNWNFDEKECVANAPLNSDHSFSTNLVWIEARVGLEKHPAMAARQVLHFVLNRLQSHAQLEDKCPVLLVTFRKGYDFVVCEPLTSGLAENQIHVPLWIRPSKGHACRVQALTGSFDLLPTVITFLGSAEATVEVSPPDVAQLTDSSDRVISDTLLSSEPKSLASLCGAPQVCPNRLLKIRGDGWKAARTEEFFLVISDGSRCHADKTESDGDDSEEPFRRLYVKPEDRFNVNEMSGTYATVADDLFQLLE